MIVVRNSNEIEVQGIVATIGFFDGVHLGHRFLIDELRSFAHKLNMPSAVITFPEHPRQILHSDYQPQLLSSFNEKIERLASLCVDYCIVLDFTQELSMLSASEFISLLARQYKVRGLLIGYDHRFGHNRSEGFEQYVEYGRQADVKVIKASAYNCGNTKVSSSEIRRLLADGDVERAKQLLTYPYQLNGRIVSGYKIGRTIGFPTANIRVDSIYKLMPKEGVYAVWVCLHGKKYKGMLYIGKRPTLHNGDNQTVEVNILHFSDDIYDDRITVSFMQYVRDDMRFDSVEELGRQLEKDRVAVDRMLIE